MLIALPTQDGNTISSHFGRSAFFVVYQVENKEIKEKQLRKNGGAHAECSHGAHQHGECSHGGHDHGTCSHNQAQHGNGQHSHASIHASLSDVEVVIAGGIGQKMFAELVSQGKIVLTTDETDCEAAVKSFLQGTLSGGGQTSCGCNH
jgi:predicted Fe-Mo cluster-binding NifX family protein